MKFELMKLPFESDALEPFLSRQTVETHYGKHHAGYLNKLDDALDGELRDKTLEEILTITKGDVFNLAAQTWNHDFYWQSLSTSAQSPKNAVLLERLNAAFGSVDQFMQQFTKAASNEFGSGWAWLLLDPVAGELVVTSTTDAVNPLTFGMTPLMTLDVWEHAYYLDYQNRRGDYINEFLSEHLNWRFVEQNLEAALLAEGVSAGTPMPKSSTG